MSDDTTLTENDLDLIHGALAAEIARCLVAGVQEHPAVRAKFDALVDLGRKLGMPL